MPREVTGWPTPRWGAIDEPLLEVCVRVAGGLSVRREQCGRQTARHRPKPPAETRCLEEALAE
eukprot:148710-Lingulodinium_polyedra.AAC.1